MPNQPLIDRFARPLRDMRISVTDRCNFRCTYCMPKAHFGSRHEFVRHGQLLTFEEINRVARIFAGLGVRKLRITGGEPLVRKNIESLISQLADNPDIYAIVSTGGTGLTQRNVAPEATAELFGRPVRGFGELFRVLSYDKIGSSTIASRAVANGPIVLNLPASSSTCRMAMDKIILNQLDARPKP